MIPPALREQLVRKLTQKLVESPTFNTLVHNTQGTISAFLDGIEEGRRQKESSEVKRSDNERPESTSHQQQQHYSHQQQYQQHQDQQSYSQQQQPASSHPTYSRTHNFEKPRSSSYIDPRTPKPPPPETEASSSSSSTSTDGSQPGLSDLEAFLRRTKASLEEAERRADAQRKNNS